MQFRTYGSMLRAARKSSSYRDPLNILAITSDLLTQYQKNLSAFLSIMGLQHREPHDLVRSREVGMRSIERFTKSSNGLCPVR